MTANWMKLGAATCALALLGACATTANKAETKDTAIYVDPDTGEVATDPDASDEAKAAADMLGAVMRGDLPDDHIWKLDADGNATHLQSGMICPKVWSGYQRGEPIIFKQNGQDVGCNYSNAERAIVTFYTYRTPHSMEEELEAIMETVVKARNPVHKESDVFIATSAGAPMQSVGDAITFAAEDGEIIQTGLYLANAAGWRLKVRVTYPEAISDSVENFAGISMLGQYDRIVRKAGGGDTRHRNHAG